MVYPGPYGMVIRLNQKDCFDPLQAAAYNGPAKDIVVAITAGMTKDLWFPHNKIFRVFIVNEPVHYYWWCWA